MQENRTITNIKGVVKIILDVFCGSAVIIALAYLFWLWEPNFYLIRDIWGVELSDFGKYINVLKSSAFITLMIGLLALGKDEAIGNVYATYFFYGYTREPVKENSRRKNQSRRSARQLTAILGGSFLILVASFSLLPN